MPWAYRTEFVTSSDTSSSVTGMRSARSQRVSGRRISPRARRAEVSSAGSVQLTWLSAGSRLSRAISSAMSSRCWSAYTPARVARHRSSSGRAAAPGPKISPSSRRPIVDVPGPVLHQAVGVEHQQAAVVDRDEPALDRARSRRPAAAPGSGRRGTRWCRPGRPAAAAGARPRPPRSVPVTASNTAYTQVAKCGSRSPRSPHQLVQLLQGLRRATARAWPGCGSRCAAGPW